METVFIGYDGSIDLQLWADGARLTVAQMQAITDMAVVYKGQVLRASDNAGAFDWVSRAAESVVVIKLGGVIDEPGTDIAAELVVFTADYPNGVPWGSVCIRAKALV